mgnify:CR=1 FL=1
MSCFLRGYCGASALFVDSLAPLVCDGLTVLGMGAVGNEHVFAVSGRRKLCHRFSVRDGLSFQGLVPSITLGVRTEKCGS